MDADFTITFPPGMSREQAEEIIEAFENLWKACGGTGFEVVYEEEIVGGLGSQN